MSKWGAPRFSKHSLPQLPFTLPLLLLPTSSSSLFLLPPLPLPPSFSFFFLLLTPPLLPR